MNGTRILFILKILKIRENVCLSRFKRLIVSIISLAAKFTEDGSFIGQYGNKKKGDPNLPSPMATFV